MASTKRVQYFIDSFIENHNRVTVFTLGNTSSVSMSNNYKGNFNGVNYYNFGSTFTSQYLYYFFYFFVLLNSIRRLLSVKDSSVKNILYLYGSITLDNFLLILFAKAIGYKIIADIGENYQFSNENMSFIYSLKLKSIIFFEKRISFFCHGIVALSTYLCNVCKEKVKNKIPVILIPISYNLKVSYNKKKFNSPLRITYSGSFGKKDGIDTLIQAFKDFNSKYSNSTLLLTGFGNNPSEMVSKANHSSIKYVGFLEDKEYQKFISEADILCMTRTSSEYANAGFPFKLGEFLKTGNPVVATDVSDVSYYLENYKDCVITSPDKPDEISAAFEFYVENVQRALEIGRNGQLKAEKFFDYKINGKKMLEFMNKV